ETHRGGTFGERRGRIRIRHLPRHRLVQPDHPGPRRGAQRLPPFIAARLRNEPETSEEGPVTLPIGTRPDHGDAQARVSFAVVTDVAIQIGLMLIDPYSPTGGIDDPGMPAVGLVPDRRRNALLL